MSYTLSKKEYDALHIAGFSSVEELLARYFELLKAKQRMERVIAEQGSSKMYLEAVGSDKCKIGFSYD